MITEFKNEYRFLSNFYKSPLVYKGKEYPTVEHAFQCAKTFDEAEQEKLRSYASPVIVKRAGKKVKLRPDWEDVKIDIMYEILKIKFSDPELKSLLLSTGNEILVEGNTWGDTFWGKCKGEGKNILGKLLMKVRSELE